MWSKTYFEKIYMKMFEIFEKVKKCQWKIIIFFMIFHWKFAFFYVSKNFKNVHFYFILFFRSISEKIFFGVEKKSLVQFRCKKLRPFELWCFQRVLSTLTPPSKRLHYFFAFTFVFTWDVTPLPNRSSHHSETLSCVISW